MNNNVLPCILCGDGCIFANDPDQEECFGFCVPEDDLEEMDMPCTPFTLHRCVAHQATLYGSIFKPGGIFK